mgnify:CR=1 FL=1
MEIVKQTVSLRAQRSNLKIRLFRRFALCNDKVILIILLLIFCPTFAFAKDITFEAMVDRDKVSVGESLQLNLTFLNTQNITTPQLPDIEGFQARYLGPSTRMSIINGKVTSSVTHVYTLLAMKKGNFSLGPFSFNYNNDTYNCSVVKVEVVDAGQSSAPGQNIGHTALSQNISDRVFVVMQLKKNKFYLNEPVPVTIKLFVNRVGIRDIQFPEFNHEGFSVEQYKQPKQYQQEAEGVIYEVIEFQISLFGLKPLETRLGPAIINCNLVVQKQKQLDDIFENFFGRYETRALELKSADIPVAVSALPEEGKPADFQGAIGDFTFVATVLPKEVKAEDPVTVKINISGSGNFNTVNIPLLKNKDGFKVYQPQIKQDESGKTFEQILIPLNEKITEIPDLVFSFFNPESGSYKTITQGPFPLKVLPASKEEAKIIEQSDSGKITITRQEEKLGRDLVYLKTNLREVRRKGLYLFRAPIFWVLNLIVFIAVFTAIALQRRKEKLKTDVRLARRLKAPKKSREGLKKASGLLAEGKTEEFYNVIFQTLQEFLGDRFHLASRSITADILEDTFKDKNISPEILRGLKQIFYDCDTARFASAESHAEDMKKTLKNLEEIISYLLKL